MPPFEFATAARIVFGEIGECGQVVYGADVDGAGGPDYQKGAQAVGAILRDAGLQGVDAHAAFGVAGDHAEGFAA